MKNLIEAIKNSKVHSTSLMNATYTTFENDRLVNPLRTYYIYMNEELTEFYELELMFDLNDDSKNEGDWYYDVEITKILKHDTNEESGEFITPTEELEKLIAINYHEDFN